MRTVFKEFEYWAEAFPHASALRYNGQSLSYGELNARANRLAAYLAHLGVQKGQPVAVLVSPGFDICIALLAIIKSGCIYVPLDPDYPRARLEVILDEVKPAVVLTTERLASRLPETDLRLVTLDTVEEQLTKFSDQNPDIPVAEEDTVYIFFTSGTTGKPKGVMASHANFCHYMHTARNHYRFYQTDVMPAVARFTFSISIFELMLPLSSGGTLLLLDREDVLNLPKMCETLQQVTFFHIGPSLLKSLVNYIRNNFDSFEGFARVRHASSGGDMIPPELLADIREIFSQAEVYVIYGCSEVSCMGCTYRVPEQGPITRTYVGKPMDGVTLRLVDESGNQVPKGEIGEIAFGGKGIVKGYLNNPGLTAEKYIHADGDRFYFTGDIGRFADDGNLEMLGRRDFQIQLRGMRIELAEVEFALRRSPNVKDGVVMAKEVASGEKVLVAYCVFHPGTEPDTQKVKAYLIDHLPDYMVPSRYVVLEALPLNHNMKVDRFALPHPDDVRSKDTGNPPVTETEKLIASVWSKLLNLDNIQRTDNFFDLGGYSLLGMDCVMAIEAALKIKIDGMDLLRENLAMLSALADKQLGKETDTLDLVQKPYQIETFYFGKDDRLYGAFRPAASSAKKPAVLIFPAFGSEWIRAHFVMRKVTQLLVDMGYPVMRFDFFGVGDSLGDQSQAGFKEWEEDVRFAAEEIRRRAGVDEVIGVGVRLGASLLCRYGADNGINKQILWDPIISGDYHLKKMRQSHGLLRKFNRALFPLIYQPKKLHGEELLGFHYSPEAIEGLSAFSIVEQLVPSVHVVDSLGYKDVSAQFANFMQKKLIGSHTQLESRTDWWKPAGLETLWPDRGISRAIISGVTSE
jgi:amino acid adenylation domain-containing protein